MERRKYTWELKMNLKLEIYNHILELIKNAEDLRELEK